MPPPPIPTDWAHRRMPLGPRIGIPSGFEPGRVSSHQLASFPGATVQPPAMGYSAAHQAYASERSYRAKLSYASGLIDTLQVTVQLRFDNGKPKGQPYLVRIVV
jgi:hypothetical protein